MASSKATRVIEGKAKPDFNPKLAVGEEVYIRKTCRDASWKCYYCCVPLCHNAAGGMQ